VLTVIGFAVDYVAQMMSAKRAGATPLGIAVPRSDDRRRLHRARRLLSCRWRRRDRRGSSPSRRAARRPSRRGDLGRPAGRRGAQAGVVFTMTGIFVAALLF